MRKNLKKALGWCIIFIIVSLLISLNAMLEGHLIKFSLIAGLTVTLLFAIFLLKKSFDLIFD